MYDPLIVDAFLSMHASESKRSSMGEAPNYVLKTINEAGKALTLTPQSSTLGQITASSDEMLSVYQLAGALAGRSRLEEIGDTISNHLRRLIPSSLCVIYLYDATKDELEARYTAGHAAGLISGLRITLGQRLSGWVAANRQTILNSDAVLDLGDAARTAPLWLRTCISTPIIANEVLVGTLSLYSTEVNAFNDNHRRVIEVVAAQLAHTLPRPTLTRKRLAINLPYFQQLEELAAFVRDDQNDESNAFLVMSLSHGGAFIDDPDSESLLCLVVRCAREALRADDMLFRTSNNEIVAFLRSTTIETAEQIATRIRNAVAGDELRSLREANPSLQFAVTVVPGHSDRESLRESLSAARRLPSPEPRVH
jgi:putative methionine-R-sulfoxide reductase with GAF domain